MKKIFLIVLTFILVFSLLLVGISCKKETAEEPAEKTVEEVAEEPAVEEAAPAVEEEYTIENPKGMKTAAWSDEKTDGSQFKTDPPWTIGVSNYGLQNTWRIQMMAELQYTADQDPRIEEFIILNADGNVAKQVADIGDLLTRDIDLLLVLPVSSDGIKPAIDEFVEAGIPVIVFNNELAGENFQCMVWIDEFKFGWIGGKWLDEKLGGEGKVVILEGVAGTSTSDLRTRGALDAFSPGIEVLAKQPANWDYALSKQVMEDFIAAYPEIDGIYSQGGAMSLGALEALLAAGKDLVPVPTEGYNGFLKFWKNQLEAGKDFDSIGPDEATWQSSEALRQGIMLLEGKTIEKWHELPLPVITNENLDQYVQMDGPDDLWSNTQMSDEAIRELYKFGQ